MFSYLTLLRLKMPTMEWVAFQCMFNTKNNENNIKKFMKTNKLTKLNKIINLLFNGQERREVVNFELIKG